MGRPNKWSIELIQQYLDENFNGYNVDGEYLNDKSKITFTCNNGHASEKTLSSFLRYENKCSKCKKEQEEKEKNEEMKSTVEENDYIFIELVDKNRMLVQCEKGHRPYEVSFNNFKRGKRCNKCATERASEQLRHSYEYVKEYIEDEGLKLLSTEYKGAHEYLSVQCSCSHIYDVRFNNFKKGHRCPKCAGKYQYSYLEIKEIMMSYGYELLTPENEYKDVKQSLHVKCSNGHTTTKTKQAVCDGLRCRYCYFDELAILDALENNYSDISAYLRRYTYAWKKEVLEKYNYKCDITNSSDDLEVHHLVQFNKLVRIVFENTNIEIKDVFEDYTNEELIILKEEIKKLHTIDIGIPLNKNIHKLFHDIYGLYNTNSEQYHDFKIKYLRGEYNEQEFHLSVTV